MRTPYIRVVGLEIDQHNSGRGKPHFTDAEEEEYIRMSRQPDLYETLASSLAPSIFGNEGMKSDVKRWAVLTDFIRYQEIHHLFIVWRIEKDIA